jgi:hypothetical protein
LKYHDEDQFITGERMVTILDYYQDKIKSYANEIDHAKHDHKITEE